MAVLFRGRRHEFRATRHRDLRRRSYPHQQNKCSIIDRPTITAYAELHCHTNFSFLDGASAPDELAERAAELGLGGLAVTDHQGLYGIVRASGALEEAGVRPVIGIEVELRDSIVADPDRVVVPRRRPTRRAPPRAVAGGARENRARDAA